MNAEQKWLARPYREGDEDGILRLRKAVYPEKEYDWKKGLNWWRWLYKDNPAGVGWIWLAEHNGQIVGQYALIPIVMKVGGKTITCALGLDAMTHPDYRRQGMFETLARRTYAHAAEQGVHLIFGFPSELSYPGFIRKLGFVDVTTMQVRFKPLNWRRVLGMRIKNKLASRFLSMAAILIFNKILLRTRKPPAIEHLTISQVASFGEQINHLWAKVSNQHQIMVVRDKNYLNWRYAAPEGHYSRFVAEKAGEISGYLILQHSEQEGVKTGYIFDVFAQSSEVMHCLVSKAVEHCEQSKIDLVLSLVANKSHHRVLKRNGFLSLPFRGQHFVACSTSSSIPEQFLASVENWFVQIGDSDAV